jgi:hypothetical protein
MRQNKMTRKESLATVVGMEESEESESEAGPRSYAAVTARPGHATATEVRQPPPGPPTTTTASCAPQSPRPGGSGEGNKKRKAAKEARLTDSDDTEEDVKHADMERRYEMMKVELAHAAARASPLQETVEEFQVGLTESTSMNEELRRREEETRRLHSFEQKAQEERLKAWKAQEAQRVLAAHRQQQLRYGTLLRRSFVSHFLEYSAKLTAKFIESCLETKSN